MSECYAKVRSLCRNHGTLNLTPCPTNPKDHVAESKRFRFFLTSEEDEAVNDYLEVGYTNLNRYLHERLTEADEVDTSHEKQIKLIDSALAKYRELNPNPEEVDSYRATKTHVPFDTEEEAFQLIADTYQVGRVITMPGYTSTSTRTAALGDFFTESKHSTTPNIGSQPWQTPTLEEWQAKNDQRKDEAASNLLFIVKSRSGVPMSAFDQTYAEKEMEYLHPRDTKFVVQEVGEYRKIMNTDANNNRRDHYYATVITVVEAPSSHSTET